MAEIGNVTVRVDAVITDEQYHEAMGAVRAANERIDLLEAENAKLRELVADYFNAPCVECNPWDEGWKGCKHCDSGNCNLAVRALKLGIEVSE